MDLSTAQRHALIVLGMHRSGTSAMSGVLALLGAREPATVMPPTPDNPKGYWESVKLMGFHDRVLAGTGSAWDDWGRIDPAYFASEAVAGFRRELPEVLEHEYGDAGMILVKDPRACRVLPLWMDVLADLDIVPHVVLTLRSPYEVARSLQKRDDFTESRALLVWLRHVLDAEASTRDLRRSFVRYEDLLGDWRGEIAAITEELDISWPRSPQDAAAEIDEFLEGGLRHHRQAAEEPHPDDTLGQWVADTARALDQLATPGADREAAYTVLDAVRAEFDETAGIFLDALRNQAVQAQASVVTLMAERKEARDQLTRVENTLKRAHQGVQKELSELQQRFEAMKQRAEQHWERVLDLEGRYLDAQSQIDARFVETANLTRRLLGTERRVKLLRAELQESEQRVHDLQASTSWRVTQPMRAMTGGLKRIRPRRGDTQ